MFNNSLSISNLEIERMADFIDIFAKEYYVELIR